MFAKLRFVLCAVVLGLCCNAQVPHEKELLQTLNAAKTEEQKIVLLGDLAELYSIFLDNKKADSVLGRQLSLAEVSQQDELVLKTLSGTTIDNVAIWSSKETFDRAVAFLQKGLDYARERNHTRMEAIVYLKLAALNRKRKLFDAAIEQAALALLRADKKDDSLKTTSYLELGDAFAGKGDAVSAYKNYNSAYDLAYSSKNIPLQSATWHSFSNLYKDLGDTLLAKSSLFESLKLNKAAGSATGLLSDYISLFKFTDEPEFLNRALFLADSLQSLPDQLICKRLMLSYIMVVEKNSQKALAYVEQNPDLKLYQQNKGLPNYNTGSIYHYAGDYAEAIAYYLLDEPILLSSFEPSVQLAYFNEMADCYQKLNVSDKAIDYYEKAFALSKTLGSPAANANITHKLSDLYAAKADYQKAYSYGQLQMEYNETLKRLAKQREVTLLGLEREKKQHEKDVEESAANDLKKRNIQYTGISVLVAVMFIVLLLTGMFPISKVTIGMLNFVTFICFFEFITLMIDSWIHNITQNEPLRIWLAKIIVIFALLPLHHSAEKLALKFLSSQKLKRFRERISVRRFFHPTKKSIKHIEENLEEGTLV